MNEPLKHKINAQSQHHNVPKSTFKDQFHCCCTFIKWIKKKKKIKERSKSKQKLQFQASLDPTFSKPLTCFVQSLVSKLKLRQP